LQYNQGLLSQDKISNIDWDMVGWKKGGEDISFGKSKVNDILGFKPRKEYSSVSFTYDF